MCKEVNPFSSGASAETPKLSSRFKHSTEEKYSLHTHTHTHSLDLKCNYVVLRICSIINTVQSLTFYKNDS